MTTVTIYEATFTPREVEVPDECPECGAPFTGPDSQLRQVVWADLTYGGSLTSAGYEPDGDMEHGEEYREVGFYCRGCSGWEVP